MIIKESEPLAFKVPSIDKVSFKDQNKGPQKVKNSHIMKKKESGKKSIMSFLLERQNQQM